MSQYPSELNGEPLSHALEIFRDLNSFDLTDFHIAFSFNATRLKNQ
jgi:hypothetical protein